MKRRWLPLLLLIIALTPLHRSGAAQNVPLVSRFGEYSGYSEEKYDSWVRSSRYLTMRDGVRIAIDIIRPARGGQVTEERLPVIWSHTRYRRAFEQNGRIISSGDSPLMQMLLRHGYVIAAADVRGSGASFGRWEGIFTGQESQDAREITEWLAAQPWCDGNVGMSGGSYLGVTQLMAAGTRPESLKAIFPIVALFDIYSVAYHGGVFYDDLLRTWSDLTRMMDTEAVAAPVDGPEGKSLLETAISEHRSSRALLDIFSRLPYRDGRDDLTGAFPYREWHPAGVTGEINASGVPAYFWCGWFDSFTRDGFLMLRNFKTPVKFVIGAWSHSPKDEEIQREEFSLLAVEELRWFDYWLKGIGNGIMDEPRILYQVMKQPKENEWRTTNLWPLHEIRKARYYLGAGPSGSVPTANDGTLGEIPPRAPESRDEYAVDYSTTSGTTTRWDNAVGGGFGYGDMAANDSKGLSYTTQPLAADLEVTGHPTVHLWASSTATDGDFFAYLEEVDEDGRSHYVTEGTLRASHRALHPAPYDNLGLPYHRSQAEDVRDLVPGEPAELEFDLQPTSNVFNAGHRIRLAITCADADNAQTPRLSPAPVVSLYRSAARPSFLTLPTVPGYTQGQPADAATGVFVLAIVVIVVLTAFGCRRSGPNRGAGAA